MTGHGNACTQFRVALTIGGQSSNANGEIGPYPHVTVFVAQRQHANHDRLRLLRRNLDGTTRDRGPLQREAEDLQAGWVEIRHTIPNQDAYPPDFRIDKQRGDYTLTRFHEGSWSYVTHFYDPEATWKGAYATLTTPLAIFADEFHIVDLGVAVMHSPKHPPELRGLDTLLRYQQQGMVSETLVQKVQAEAEGLLQQFTQEEPK